MEKTTKYSETNAWRIQVSRNILRITKKILEV